MPTAAATIMREAAEKDSQDMAYHKTPIRARNGINVASAPHRRGRMV